MAEDPLKIRAMEIRRKLIGIVVDTMMFCKGCDKYGDECLKCEVLELCSDLLQMVTKGRR